MVEDEEEQVPEVSEADELLSSYARIKALLSGFENESSEWSSFLYEELNDPTKSNLLNKLNVHDDDAEFFSILKNVNHVSDRSSEFEYGQDLLDPFKLDNELDALLNSVEIAKVKSVSRAERLQAGFRKVKSAQELVVSKIVRKLKTEAGLTRIETKVREHNELIDRLTNTLAEKNQTIITNNKEKELSADELRHKHERETEEKIRDMVQTIEVKTKELSVVTSTHGRLKSEYSNLQNRLGMLLHELDVEEKAATMDASRVAVNPVMRFRASIYRNAASKGATTNLFGDVSSGTITKELVGDSQRALDEAFEKQQQLYAATAASEERTQALRKELTQLMQSEENKALDRLKKVCDNLQVKIQSDEQRVKVMATLVHQIQKGDESAHRSIPKEFRASEGTAASRKSIVGTSTHKRARSAKPLKSEAKTTVPAGKGSEPALPELMSLVPEAHERQREPISMKLHRRLHSQYYETPEDVDKESSGSDNDEAQKVSGTGVKKSLELPRKRRITSSQSSKIQKIMDMMNLQFAKLSTVKEEDIKHIFDYRTFPDDAEGMKTSHSGSLSEASGRSGGSARSRRRQYQLQQVQQAQTDSSTTGENSADHTKMFQSSETGISSSPHKRHGALAPRPPAGSRASSRGKDPVMQASTSDDYLRIPVTADLEDQSDAEFYAQNYGIKMALEHLTAFLEVLTSGNSTDTSFLSNQSGKARVTFARDEREELLTVEDLRGHIAKLISLIRELHFLSQNNKQTRKDLQKEVDSKLKECDRLRNDLLQEIEGSHWPQATKAGQYEVGIEQSKDNLKELKATAKDWDQRVSIKRAQTIRLSQMVANSSTRRASVVHKLDPQSEEILKLRKQSGSPKRDKSPTKPKSPVKTVPEKASVQAVDEKPLAIEGGRVPVAVEYSYSVANKRMSLFDDITNIYDAAMTSLKSADRSVPFDQQTVDARPTTEPRAWDFAPAPLVVDVVTQAVISTNTNPELLHRPQHSDPSTVEVQVLAHPEVDPAPVADAVNVSVEAAGTNEDLVGVEGTLSSAPQAEPDKPDSSAVYEGSEEDAGSDGWEDILHGYEADKSDPEMDLE